MNESLAPLSAAGRALPKRWLAAVAVIFAGQSFSMITSYAAGWAVIWHVTETTGSALMLAAASICAYLPQGLISPSAASSRTVATARPSWWPPTSASASCRSASASRCSSER